MEINYVEGRSDNLPGIDPFMISLFFVDNMDFLSAEIKSVKNVRAARKDYGDPAVGYVQLKRESNLCTVKGKITPEHRVRSKSYDVTIKVDEANDRIVSAECHDCTASQGGCKHAIAFIYWLLRRSEEPSPTSVACYWKKAVLSKVGTSIKLMKASNLKAGEALETFCEKQGFLDKVVEKGRAENCGANLLKYFSTQTSIKNLSLHYLGLNYFKNESSPNADSFIDYCKNGMPEELCKIAAQETINQYKSPLWYELRYARITGSKIYDASVCGVLNGALFEQIMGAVSLPDTEAMKRGRQLEDEVLQVVAQKYNIKLHKTGLILDKSNPIIGASPDSISKDYVIEVKCPSSEKTVKHYFMKAGSINKKYLAQIQLQMMLCKKNKGLFCVAAADFEDVTILEVSYAEIFIENIISKSVTFWKNSIYPALVK